MNPDSLHQDRIIEIIANELCYPTAQITPEAKIAEDLNTDSLDRLELLMALEEELQIEITDEQAGDMKTVKDIIDLTRSLLP